MTPKMSDEKSQLVDTRSVYPKIGGHLDVSTRRDLPVSFNNVKHVSDTSRKFLQPPEVKYSCQEKAF